ncbi:MAG: aminotransferase class I/II-fold pyridoxal phosphate-dependent enzyme, partial [Deltaproteobacteria bacterium]|nr:aminotransferase class I/II-fold pyridoxal phosphate-dependent enzyme [Deltaproteobacteria bacterium]
MNDSRKELQLSPIKEIELAAARVPGAVSLAQGIPSFDTPRAIKEAVKEQMDQGRVARYSLAPGLPQLREAVAESLRAEGMRYDPDGEIIITAGSIEAIAATLMTITGPGDEVIIPSPTYASYQQVIRMAGAVPVFAPLNEENNFDLDIRAIQKRITPRTRAIFYCNPNNPTGTLYSREESLKLMDLAERHGLMILTDEVYKDFLYTSEPYFTPAQVDSFRRRVVRVFSFSKAYAMTGWRVGYLHTHRELADDILKVHDSLVTCAPVVSQYAAMAALELAQPDIQKFHAAYRVRRDLALRRLDGLSRIFDYQKPMGAYFVFPRIKDTVALSHDSRRLAFDLLEKAGVALVPGIGFGPTGESHLRISFGREEADLVEAFNRMEQYFQPRKKSSGGTAVFPISAEPNPAAPRQTPGSADGRGGRLRRWGRRMAVGYLNRLAKIYLRRKKPIIIAIAGNQGKTVLKRMISGLLRQKYRVRANPRSYNTEIGLPLAVLGLEINPRSMVSIARTLTDATRTALWGRERPDILVLELGVRQPGDMAVLLQTVHPHWAVITNFFQDGQDPGENDLLTAEALALARGLPPENMVISRDDPLLAPLWAGAGGMPMAMGRGLLRPDPEGGCRFTLGKTTYIIRGDLVGDSAQYAAQAAVILGEKMGMTQGE